MTGVTLTGFTAARCGFRQRKRLQKHALKHKDCDVAEGAVRKMLHFEEEKGGSG